MVFYQTLNVKVYNMYANLHETALFHDKIEIIICLNTVFELLSHANLMAFKNPPHIVHFITTEWNADIIVLRSKYSYTSTALLICVRYLYQDRL